MTVSKIELAKKWKTELIDVYKYEKTINALFALGVLYKDNAWSGILWKRNKKDGKLTVYNQTEKSYPTAQKAAQGMNALLKTLQLTKTQAEELKLPTDSFVLLKQLDEEQYT